MIILKNLFHFNLTIIEMLEIYSLYIRSMVEQASVVWSSSLTAGLGKSTKGSTENNLAG